MQFALSRLGLVGRAFAFAACFAVLPAMAVPWAAPVLWLFIMMGPFAGLWMTNTWGQADALRWAVVCGLAFIAHPLWPGPLTCIITVLGVMLWVFLGLMLTFNGV